MPQSSPSPTPGEYSAPINGLNLWYRVEGNGPVCIVPTPGWGVSADYLFLTLTPLTTRFTLVCLETRGTGRSQGPAMAEGAYGWDDFVSDLEAFRAHLGQEKVWLLGHSEAGVHVLNYGLKYPEHLQGLLIVDSYPASDAIWGEDRDARIQARAQELWFAEAVKGLYLKPRTTTEAGQMLRTILPFYFADVKKMEQQASVFGATTCAIEPVRNQKQRFPFSLADRLAEINIPTLIVVGSDDFICSPIQARRLHQGIAGSALLLIEKAGHFPWMEQPEAFFNGVLASLPGLGYR